MKKDMVICGPVGTCSGYGAHARDLFHAFYESGKYNIKVIDVRWGEINAGDYIIIDCWRAVEGGSFAGVWNDSFLKRYTTALFKRQWGMNLIKFTGVKLPGGIEFNGRQIYDDAQREIDEIREKMLTTY